MKIEILLFCFCLHLKEKRNPDSSYSLFKIYNFDIQNLLKQFDSVDFDTSQLILTFSFFFSFLLSMFYIFNT